MRHHLELIPGEKTGDAMGAESSAPVIIKRKKVVGGEGHHGGAWKVAIAFPFEVARFAP